MLVMTNLAYGRHWISWRVRMVAPILRKPPKNMGTNLSHFSTLESIVSGHSFEKKLNCYIFYAVRAVDLIPTLRARPHYQISADWTAASTSIQWLRLRAHGHGPMRGLGTELCSAWRFSTISEPILLNLRPIFFLNYSPRNLFVINRLEFWSF